MEKNEVDILKKLSKRRKMFEDYISQAKKPEGVRMGRERWDVRCEKWNIRNGPQKDVRRGNGVREEGY